MFVNLFDSHLHLPPRAGGGHIHLFVDGVVHLIMKFILVNELNNLLVQQHSNKQQATSNKQQAINNKQQTTNNQQPTTKDVLNARRNACYVGGSSCGEGMCNT